MEFASVFSIIASVLYLSATIAILSRLFHAVGPNKTLVISLGISAVAFHGLAVIAHVFIQQPINFSLPNVISLVALIISTGMTLTAIKYKANLILPVVYGFSAILLAVLLIVPNIGHTTVDPKQLVLVLHITFALAAYCVLVIATLYSFQVAFINYKLKQKKLTAVNNLPPLLQVEGQLFLIMGAGTICLVLSELVGLLFIDNFFAKANIHKSVLSVIALSMYLVILWGHYSRGWRGKIVVSYTTLATLILTLAYFGSRFVKEFLIS